MQLLNKLNSGGTADAEACVGLYYPIPTCCCLFPVCVWGVGVPGVAAVLPSSSGELHQQQGWDSAYLQEELWVQHTARNYSRLERLQFSHRT